MLQADVAVISGMVILGSDWPASTYSLRGALSLELEVTGHKRDLHSGTFGGVVHKPLQALSEIIAQLHDADGRIAISGFYDKVRRWPDAEWRYMARAGLADEEILRNAGSTAGWGEPSFSLYERRPFARRLPSLALPAATRALAKLNFRLVPDQDPGKIE